MNHGYSREIAPALEALSLSFPDRLTWMGEPVSVVIGANAPLVLIDTITSLLYSQFYCYGRPVPLPRREPGRQVLAGGLLVERLRRANQEGARWTRGWRVLAASGKGVRVSRGGLRMSVAEPEEWREIGHGEVEVRSAPESLSASPGYFLVQSPERLAQHETVRLYWNTTPDGAVALVERVTTLLRRAAYRVKVLTSFARSERADSSVLYLGRPELMHFADALSRIYEDIQGEMRAATPAFTLRLARGLALAENPRNGESFGRNRCMLVAEALVDMAQSGKRIEPPEVARHFEKRGLTLERPYLGEGSQQEYSLPVSVAVAEARTVISSDRDKFLRMAVRIGDYLVRSAIWSQEACNWTAELGNGGYGALDPTLYSGTSGIAWFLAELSRACGDERFSRTASAALSHAYRGLDAQRQTYGNGLYSGAAGVAYVAWRCASLLDQPKLLDESQRIFKRVLRTVEKRPSRDLISGEAGIILALAAVGSNVSGIERLGRTLVASARRTQNMLSWRTGNAKRSQNLTGFSHGTAGIAAALLALYEQTGRVEFRNAADGAIQYERACFNEVEGNWPDYRAVPASYTVSWCHGAPGIALSRALAVRACGPAEDYMRDLAVALETTRSTIASIESGTDFCLCHGVTGNADVLHLVGQNEDRTLVEQAASFVIETCGAFAEKPPGLMTGWAGIGHFYLRLADANVPSPLWIGPSLGRAA